MAVVGLVAGDGGDPQAGDTAYRDHPQFQDFLSSLCLKNLPRGKTTTIRGEVRRPAIYEVKEGERLKQALESAGGLQPTAYIERIQIDRIVPFLSYLREILRPVMKAGYLLLCKVSDQRSWLSYYQPLFQSTLY